MIMSSHFNFGTKLLEMIEPRNWNKPGGPQVKDWDIELERTVTYEGMQDRTEKILLKWDVYVLCLEVET